MDDARTWWPKCISPVGVRLIISHLSVNQAWGIILLRVLQIKLKTSSNRNANEILQQMFTFRQKQNFQSSTLLRCGSKYSLFCILIASFIFNPLRRLWSIISRKQLFKEVCIWSKTLQSSRLYWQGPIRINRDAKDKSQPRTRADKKVLVRNTNDVDQWEVSMTSTFEQLLVKD